MPPTKATWGGTDSQGNPLRWDQPGLVWGGDIPEPKNKRKTMQLRVNLGFANAPDHTLEEIAGAVSENLYGDAAYPTPPVTQAALDASLTAFTNAIAVQAQGGTAATADKHNKREALIGLLRQLAGYVQETHGNDLAVLLSSGFEAVSTNRASSPLAKPRIKDILNGNSGQLILRGTPVANARCFEVRYAAIGAGGALWVIFRADIGKLLALHIGKGEAIYFAGCVAHALYAPLVRKLNRGEPAVVFTFGMMVAGWLILTGAGLPAIRATDWTALPAIVWVTLLYIAIFASAATFVLMQYAAMRLPAAKVMAYTYLVPSWVILWEIALGRAAPPPLVLGGVVLSVAALALLLKDDA